MLFPVFLPAQQKNVVPSCKVRTLRAFVEGNEMAFPAIELNGENQIQIEFDLMENQYRNIDYRVLHVDNSNQPSNVMVDEYMEGFEVNRVTDFAGSVNTSVDYVHYQLLLPNSDVNIKASGKYEVQFFESGLPDSIITRSWFYIFEPMITVNCDVVRPVNAEQANNSQEVRLTLNHSQFEINDVFNDILVIVMQNGCPIKSLSNIKPVFISNQELVYGFSGENVFMGGNEFRVIDTRSLKYKASSLNRSELIDGSYHVYTPIEESRSFKRYFSDTDQNGQFFIYADNAYDYYKSADYANVHMVLKVDEPFLEGSVHLLGAFNSWQFSDAGKLSYNFENRWYEGTMVLKQGYYNYLFVYRNNFTGEVDFERLEGSHDETENNYQILVFYKSYSDNLQRLVGYRVVNSRYK